MRPNLSTILSPAFDDPLMSHQYAIESVSSIVFDVNALFPPKFFISRVESFDIPFKTFSVDERHIMTTKKYYAGFNSFNGFNATFFEDSNSSAMKGFVKWQRRMVNENADYFPANHYQVTMNVALLDFTDTPKVRLQFLGVFPTQVTPVQMTGDAVTRIQVQVSFSVNEVKWII